VSINERRLVLRAKQGDSAAFEALVRENAQYVFNLAIRILGDPHEAEDLSQEAFLRVWRALPRFRAEARFRTWLYRIVANLCYNRIPQMKVELAALDPEDAVQLKDERTGPEAGLLTAELESRLHAAIGELPKSYRMLITLRHLQGLTYAEIAEVTSQPIGTVKTGIFRGRRILKTVIEDYEAENE
jgi:RNA polymerase sigma-70 factor (ECF subfamily)